MTIPVVGMGSSIADVRRINCCQAVSGCDKNLAWHVCLQWLSIAETSVLLSQMLMLSIRAPDHAKLPLNWHKTSRSQVALA